MILLKSISNKSRGCLGATLFFMSISIASFGQTYQWNDPTKVTFPVVHGRYWQSELKKPFDRLPATAESKLRPELWRLSQNSAGEYISFTTNANHILVQYSVEKSYTAANSTLLMMSGVDLYLKDTDGHWHWTQGKTDFGDTINVEFDHIAFNGKITEYRLYLPMYRVVSQLQIGVPKNASFEFAKIEDKKPIVIYGTSILQGTSASRPGLGWSSILGRKLNKEVINLGFSGNGQLEPAMLDLINQIDASVFVLDCLPNLHDIKKFSNEELEKRLLNAIKTIRKVHPLTPILLTEHASGIPGVNLDSTFAQKYARVNQVLKTTFEKLSHVGSKHIFLLSAKEIGFDAESTIDGTHPTDIGMMKYANAYEKILKKLSSLNSE
jgi:lysophospholipase L1-like esterase